MSSAFPMVERSCLRQQPSQAFIRSTRPCRVCTEDTAEPYRAIEPPTCPRCAIRAQLEEA